MILRTPNEISNEIRMARSQFAGAFLIVEGKDDRLFMEHHISPNDCRIDVANGKEQVCEVMDILDKDNFGGALGLIDADFDRLNEVPEWSQNLVMADFHDLDAMLVRSPALGHVLTEFGNQSKLKSFGPNVLEALLERATPIGYLRLYSAKNGLNLRFRGLNYSAWIDRTSFVVNIGNLVREVKNRSQRQDLVSSELENAVNAQYHNNYSSYDICNGTDLIEILSIGLRGVLGTNDSNDVNSRQLKRSLRLAYSVDDFASSQLMNDVKQWEYLSRGFRVLKSEYT